MTKNVLIVEDKRASAEMLRVLVQEIDNDINVFIALNKEEAYARAMETEMDLMLVDIVLDTEDAGDVSGMKFAGNMRKVEKYKFVPIIFITALEDPKFYSYAEIHCYSYIEKPFDVENTKKIIREALEYKREKQEPEKYIYRKDGVFYSIDLKDVVYIQNEKRKVTFCMVEDKITVPYVTFEKLLADINNHNFIQCSRACVINKEYVESVDAVNRYIKLKNVPKQIEIGVIMKKKFLEKFLEK